MPKKEEMIKVAEKLINNCDTFEIRNLDANSRDDSPKIIHCNDYIKDKEKQSRLKRIAPELKTGITELDETEFIKCGRITAIFTNDIGYLDQQCLNNFCNKVIVESVKNDLRVLCLFSQETDQGENFKETFASLNCDSKDNSFSNKPLFVTECSEYEPLANTNRYGERGILQKLEKKIKALKINILYIPEIENFLFQYSNEEQIKTLHYLSTLAQSLNISVFFSLFAGVQYQNNEDMFFNVRKVDKHTFNKNIDCIKNNVFYADNICPDQLFLVKQSKKCDNYFRIFSSNNFDSFNKIESRFCNY